VSDALASGPAVSVGRPTASAHEERGYPEELRELVEKRLAEVRFSREPATDSLEEAMRYSLLSGGKRIRPVLTLATATAMGREPAFVLPIAVAIELIHTYSLIHDDLPAMDDDALRRGRPTCHVAFAENVAILAGDGLFAEAYRTVLEDQAGDPENVLSALKELSGAVSVSGMVGGQYIDVSTGHEVGEEGLRHMHELKTGRLIAASVSVVPLLLGAPEQTTAGLNRFGAELGVLFQIVDDILDVTGSQEEMGKARGSDERLGKRTYVSVFGLERARELASDAHSRAQAALASVQPALAGDSSALAQIADFIHTRHS
jgi:geranylgeranyl diphosphate synthase, type II